MQFLYYMMMLAGGAALCLGFYLSGERKGLSGWAGILLLFAGLIGMFLGVLLAFSPRFFS